MQLKGCGNEIDLGMFWGRPCEKESNLLSIGRVVTSYHGIFREVDSNAMVQWEGGGYKNKSDGYYTVKLFWNPFSLPAYHELLVYIPDGKENELVKGTIFSLVRYFAWIVNSCIVLIRVREPRCALTGKICRHIWK